MSSRIKTPGTGEQISVRQEENLLNRVESGQSAFAILIVALTLSLGLISRVKVNNKVVNLFRCKNEPLGIPES